MNITSYHRTVRLTRTSRLTEVLIKVQEDDRWLEQKNKISTEEHSTRGERVGVPREYE